MKYFIQTLGCQMNYSDSERIGAVLASLGFEKVEQPEEADLILYNTCMVRQKAEDRVLGQVRHWMRLRKKRPDLKVGITGCMVQKSSTQRSAVKDKVLKRMPAVDLVFRIEDVGRLEELLTEVGLDFRQDQVQDEKPADFSVDHYLKIKPRYTNQFQAFIPIMTGCDNFCSYCVVPYARGRERSRPKEEILEEARELVKNGCVEITLLGQNVNSYGLSKIDQESNRFGAGSGQVDSPPLSGGGNDTLRQAQGDKQQKPPFVELLEELNQLEGLKWIRFTSSHPKDMSDELIEAVAKLPKLCKHIHLPVQSGDNAVLKRMNRNYTREHYLELVRKIREKMPDAALTSDIIVGFPGETEEEFQNTVRLFEEVRWDMVYIGRYSPRPETVSAREMEDDVDRNEKGRRWHALNEVLGRISLEKNKEYEGRKVEVLFESFKNGLLTGKTETFKTVLVGAGPAAGEDLADLVGKFAPVEVKEAQEWVLKGELA